MAWLSRFCVFWMRKTIRNVTIVVLVLITSCHVSLQWKIGPVIPHTTITEKATMNAAGWPVAHAVHLANRLKALLRFIRAPGGAPAADGRQRGRGRPASYGGGQRTSVHPWSA